MHSNPSFVINLLTSLIKGLKTRPATEQYMVDGKTVTAADWISLLQGDLAILVSVVDAEQLYRTTLKTRDEALPGIEKRSQTVRQVLKASFGRQNPMLTDFGIDPDKKPRALSVEEKVERVGKNKATRAARHTMGKRQKAAITGESAAASTDPAATGSNGSAANGAVTNGAGSSTSH